MYNNVLKLASAIHNNILSGLAGYHTNYSISMELLEDAVIEERLSLMTLYIQKGLISPKDLYVSINCITVDCKNIEKCRCKSDGTPKAHFEIPLLANDFGSAAILYIGTTDKEESFIVYTSPTAFRNKKYRKRGKNKPYIWIDITPNENGMYDCFIFNAPLIKEISITAIFKDLRQLDLYSCCTSQTDDLKTPLDAEIIDRVSKKMMGYYRQAHMYPMPNNQMYTPG